MASSSWSLFSRPAAAPAPTGPSRDPAQLAAVIADLAALPASSPACVPPARTLAELVAWADQNDVQPVLDKFWEARGMAVLVDKATAAEACVEVQIQVLQTASILVQGLRSDTSLFQLLSMGRCNALITHPFALDSDEELCAHYVSFLKTITVRMDATTLNFFFDRESFPLYSRALSLFGSAESMVRKAVRSVILLVMRIDDSELKSFINARPDDFKAIARFIAGRLPLIESMVEQPLPHDEAWGGHVTGLLLDVGDDLGFIQDAYGLGGFEEILDSTLQSEMWSFILSRIGTSASYMVAAQAVLRVPRSLPVLLPGVAWEPVLTNLETAEEVVLGVCTALFAAASSESCPDWLISRRQRTTLRLMRELTGQVVEEHDPYPLALVGALALQLARPFARAGTHRLLAKLLVLLVHDDRETSAMLIDAHSQLVDAAYERAAEGVRSLPRDEGLLDALEVEWRDITSGGPLDVNSLVTRAELLADVPWSPTLALRSPVGAMEEARTRVHSFVVIRLARSTLRGERDVALSALGRADVVKQGAQLDLRRCEVVPVVANNRKLVMVLVAGALVLVAPTDVTIKEGTCACVVPLQCVRQVSVATGNAVTVSLSRQVPLSSRIDGKWTLVMYFDSELKVLFAKEHVERAVIRAVQLKLQRVGDLLESKASALPASASELVVATSSS